MRLGGTSRMLAPCLSCNHGFSLRIAPLERVCARCGTLHVLQSGIWRLGSRAAESDQTASSARTARQSSPKLAVVSALVSSRERRTKS
jgi:hypothetical protein